MSGRGVLAVAASGGRDSTALLHATARLARDSQLTVMALHVHHGLMPQADAWWRQLAQQCSRWRRSGLPVHFVGTRLAGRPQRGESVEAWARRERYRALAAMAQASGAKLVLLAHHRRDQAETFLLQALRGAGPRGLSGMPEVVERAGITWCRPWLNASAEAIEAYVRRYRLKLVIDESNFDSRFARSRMRMKLWPTLLTTFPDAEQALVSAARQAQEVQAVLDEVAAQDMAHCCDEEGRLMMGPWKSMSSARQTQLLRHWLRQHAGRGMPETLVQRLHREWPAAGSGHRWPAEGAWVHSGSGVLLWVDSPGVALVSGAQAIAVMDLSRPGLFDAPGWAGRWHVAPCEQAGGVPAELLRDVQLRARSGSERFQKHERSVPRSLKKQFQAAGIPVVERTGPLLYAQGRLIYVPGLGIDARAVTPGQCQRVTVAWIPDRRGASGG